jgi:excisionase family DNA binding protein
MAMTLASDDEVQQRYFSLDEVARFLGVRRSQVYALVRSGDLPAIKLGGRGVWRVDRRQLDTYLAGLHAATATWTQQHPLQPSGMDWQEPDGAP